MSLFNRISQAMTVSLTEKISELTSLIREWETKADRRISSLYCCNNICNSDNHEENSGAEEKQSEQIQEEEEGDEEIVSFGEWMQEEALVLDELHCITLINSYIREHNPKNSPSKIRMWANAPAIFIGFRPIRIAQTPRCKNKPLEKEKLSILVWNPTSKQKEERNLYEDEFAGILLQGNLIEWYSKRLDKNVEYGETDAFGFYRDHYGDSAHYKQLIKKESILSEVFWLSILKKANNYIAYKHYQLLEEKLLDEQSHQILSDFLPTDHKIFQNYFEPFGTIPELMTTTLNYEILIQIHGVDTMNYAVSLKDFQTILEREDGFETPHVALPGMQKSDLVLCNGANADLLVGFRSDGRGAKEFFVEDPTEVPFVVQPNS